jgi:hypothetical protein
MLDAEKCPLHVQNEYMKAMLRIRFIQCIQKVRNWAIYFNGHVEEVN